MSLVPIAAYPAVLVNAAHGQNGFLSAALVGGGLLVMDRRPVLAGVCFGAMAMKPQLAIALPFALIFASRWKTLAVAAAAAAAFCGLSVLVFGAPAWSGFFGDSAFARAALEDNFIGNQKMVSVFAAIRLWQGPLWLAYAFQGLSAAAALGALLVLQRRAFRAPGEAAAVICAGLLATPFLLDYDLTLLLIPLTWLLRTALSAGFLPYEKTLLGFAYLLPLTSRTLAIVLGVPIAPPTIIAVFVLVLRRACLVAPAKAGVEGRPARRMDPRFQGG